MKEADTILGIDKHVPPVGSDLKLLLRREKCVSFLLQYCTFLPQMLFLVVLLNRNVGGASLVTVLVSL